MSRFRVADCRSRVETKPTESAPRVNAIPNSEEREFQMTSQQLSVKVAINSWRLVLERTDKIFSNLTEEQLLTEVAPGKNRLTYRWGHITASHNGRFPILGL